MAKVKILLDPVGNIMNIWWGKPSDAYKSVEVDDPNRNDVIVMDKNGKPISIEIVGVFPKELNISDAIKSIGINNPKEPYLLSS